MIAARTLAIAGAAALLGACAGPAEQPAEPASADAGEDRQRPVEEREGGPMERSVTEEVLLGGPDETEPPPEPAPEPRAAAEPVRPERPAWWLEEPEVGPSGFATTVEAEAGSVPEARSAAVERALSAVAAQYGKAPTGTRIEKTLIVNPEPGLFRAFVYVACDAPTSATADAGDDP